MAASPTTSEERGRSAGEKSETRRAGRGACAMLLRMLDGGLERGQRGRCGGRAARKVGAREALVAGLRRRGRVVLRPEALGRVREVVQRRRLLADHDGERKPEGETEAAKHSHGHNSTA